MYTNENFRKRVELSINRRIVVLKMSKGIGAVASNVDSQQEDPGFKSQVSVCMGSLWALCLPPTVQKYVRGGLAKCQCECGQLLVSIYQALTEDKQQKMDRWRNGISPEFQYQCNLTDKSKRNKKTKLNT